MKLNSEILSDEIFSREHIFVSSGNKKTSLTVTTFSAQPECLEYLYNQKC